MRPHWIRSIVLIVAGFGSYTTESRAELSVSINLLGPPHSIRMQSQTDPRWSGFPVGPTAFVTGPQTNINIGRCGCFLTSLSTAFEGFGAISSPWYPHTEYVASGGTGLVVSFSPAYIDLYLNQGPAANLTVGWGYTAGSGGMTCGVAIIPGALDVMGQNFDAFGQPVPYATGITWVEKGWTWFNRQSLDAGLESGHPSVVIRKTFKDAACQVEGSGKHANLIVGWNAANDPAIPVEQRGKYLIFDPMRSVNGGLEDAKVAALCGANDEERYQNYVDNITDLFPLEPTTAPGVADWMIVKDDPEPIMLRLTDPRGRRTGHDPETGENLQEDPSAFYSEFTSFADPLGLLPEAPVYRYVAARNPDPGGYGLEVFGIGDGLFTLTLATSSGGAQNDAATVTGNIVAGEIKHYEIERAANGSVTIDAVAAFAPRARAGNDATAFLGDAISFDGRGSYQVSGTIASYSWDFGDGTSASGSQQTHTYATAGTFTANLTVTSVEGLTAKDQRTAVVIDAAALPPTGTLRVNVSSANAQATGPSADAQITPDGRYVVFMSTASNLVPGDTNASPDVFVKDLSNGAIERASVATGGAQAVSGLGFTLTQEYPSITPDGRFVSFTSTATNLFASDTELTQDMYIHDRTLGTTELLVPQTSLSNSSRYSSLSADGRYVAFDTNSALVPEDTNSANDVYVLDRQTAGLERVSVSDTGGEANGPSSQPRISADGNLVAFLSSATNLRGPGGTAGVFVRNRQAGTTEIVSLTAAGSPISKSTASPSMSADGRYVAFTADQNDVVPGDNNAGNGDSDVFVRDRMVGTTQQASVSSTGEGANRMAGGAELSADGRYVAFVSLADNLAPRGAPSVQAYLRDLHDKTTVQVSVDSNGMAGSNPAVTYALTGGMYGVSVASNGAVVFSSTAANLVANDTNGTTDVFLHGPIPTSSTAASPIANLGGPYLGWASSEAVPAGIRLDGSASADPTQRSVIAHWTFGDGSPIVDGALITTHAYTKPGVYEVSLTVTASPDTSQPITTEVEVMPALTPDGLSAGSCAAPGGTVSLSGAAVIANAALVKDGWDTSAGSIPIKPAIVTMPWGEVTAPTHLPGLTFRKDTTVPASFASGSYTAGVAGTAGASFKVPCGTTAKQLPLAVAGGPLYHTQAGIALTLDGSGSSDAEGAPLTYRWTFGDATTGTGVTPSHTYAVEGNYMVGLIVNDGTEDSLETVGTKSFAMVVVSANGETMLEAGAAREGGAAPDAGLKPETDELHAAGGGCSCSTTARESRYGLAFGIALMLAARRRRQWRAIFPAGGNGVERSSRRLKRRAIF